MATKLTTGFEKFAKQQRETNPDITETEIEQLWSQQPLSKRIASGISSAVLTPARAIAAIPEAVGAGYEKLDEFSRSGPNLKVDTRNLPPLWGPEREKLKAEQQRTEPVSPPIEQPEVKKEPELQKLSTPEVKKTIKTRLAEVDKIVKEPPPAASPEEIDRFKQQRDEAYKLFKEARDRNDWLQLAQILGQAVTQFGAAQVGMRTGRPMAGLQIPGIDYEARTGQEQRLLESKLRGISEEQEREDTLARRLKQEQREKAADLRAERELQLREREARQIKESPEERQIRREERAEQRKEYTKQIDALQEAVGAQQIIASGDTTKKQKEKARDTLLTAAASAGIDLEKIIDQSQVPGTLYGTNTDQDLVLRNLKDALEKRKTARQSTSSSATIPSASSQEVEGMVTVTHKATGQVRQFPANSLEAQRAKSNPEFEVR